MNLSQLELVMRPRLRCGDRLMAERGHRSLNGRESPSPAKRSARVGLVTADPIGLDRPGRVIGVEASGVALATLVPGSPCRLILDIPSLSLAHH